MATGPSAGGRITRRVSGALVASVLAACAAPQPPAPADGSRAEAPSAADAERAFAEVERRLLEEDELRLAFVVSSEGAFAADLEGTLAVSGAERLALRASGTFGRDTVELELDLDDGVLAGGNGPRTFRDRASPHAHEAVLIGLTRMGVLHNLARLVGGRPPDHAEGGVRDWVRVEDVEWTPSEGSSRGRALRFRILVAGGDAGEAELRLDADGLPLRRLQTVRFPQGEMRVTEEYRWP